MNYHWLSSYDENIENRLRAQTFILTAIIMLNYFIPLFIIDIFSEDSILRLILLFILPLFSPIMVIIRESRLESNNINIISPPKLSLLLFVLGFFASIIPSFFILAGIALILDLLIGGSTPGTNAMIIFASLTTITISITSVFTIELGFIRRYLSTDLADDTSLVELSAADKDTQTQSQSKFSTEDAATDLNKKEKMDTDYLQKNATDAISRAEDAKAQGQYQQAAAAYEEAVSQFEQAIAAADGETKEQLQAEIKETRALLEAATASLDQHNSVATTLQAAERSFKEGIARYVGGSQTVARIRFRQARDAFEEAQQAIDDSDSEMFAQPIEVSFEEEAMLPSMALKELDVLDESTVETLAAADIESITDLEAEQENEEITPAVVSDLKESDQISSDETALLTILSWWYEGASRQFTSETVISRRCELSDYGFIKSA